MDALRPPRKFDPRVQHAMSEVRTASIEFTRAFHALHRAAPGEADRRKREVMDAERKLRAAEEIAARLARDDRR